MLTLKIEDLNTHVLKNNKEMKSLRKVLKSKDNS